MYAVHTKRFLFLFTWAFATGATAQNLNPATPNIVVIYADDLGYGDVQAYNPAGLIPTPNIDRLQAEGMRFTRAHSASGVCTPSRYSLLTGRYSFRLATDGVLSSSVAWDYSVSMFQNAETTVGHTLQSNGYHTACFGKWHLGMQHFRRNGNPLTGTRTTIIDPTQIDITRVEQTPINQGFSYFWGMPNTINIPPFCWMENSTVLFQGLPATTNSPWAIINNDLWDPDFNQTNASPVMIQRAAAHISQRATNAEPFFIYVSLFSPHKPWVVTSNFQGSVGYTYGDFVHETDAWVGDVLNAIDASPVASNTLVIFTSDNGPETSAFTDSRTFGHDANGPLHGVKRDSWEGGTRVPFLVRWPGVVATNSTTDELVWQGDLLPTIADHVGIGLASNVAPDGESFLPILLGNLMPTNRRDAIVTASIDNQLSLHTLDGWKLIDGTGGGGNGTSYDADNLNQPNAYGNINGTPRQLFDLTADLGERTNLVGLLPAKEAELLARLDEIRGLPTIPLMLLDHWTLDDPAGTLATNATGGTNGVVSGGVTTGQPGQIGTAFQFDGSSSSLVTMVDYKGVVGTTARSVSLWLSTSNNNSGRGLLSWGQDATGQAWDFTLDNGRPRLNLNGGNTIGSYTVNQGTWQHLAVVYQDDLSNPNVDDVRLYINGSLNPPSATLPLPLNTASILDVALGVNRSRNQHFIGSLDDVGLWQGALPAGHVRALYELGRELTYNLSEVQSLVDAHALGTNVVVQTQTWSYATGLVASVDGDLIRGGGFHSLVLNAFGGTGMRTPAAPGLGPMLVKVAYDQTSRFDLGSDFYSGSTLVGSDIVCRERASDTQTNLQGVTFFKLDLAGLTTTEVNTATFRADLALTYSARVNNQAGNGLLPILSQVPDANTWSDVPGDFPLAAWVGGANLGAGLNLGRDHTLINNVLNVNPPRDLVADVTDAVRDWVNGVASNNGFVLFGPNDTNQGAGFSNPTLTISQVPTLRDHWPLNETGGTNALNRTGGTPGFIGTGVAINQPGMIGQAFALDGTSNGVVTILGDKGILDNQARTVSLWVNPTAAGGLVSWGRNTPADAWDFIIDTGDGSLRCNSSSAFVKDNQDLRGSGWRQLAVRFSHGPHNTTELFVDGLQVATTQGGSQINNAVTTFALLDVEIGSNRSRNLFLNALVDDVALWQGELKSGELNALFNLASEPSLNYDASQALVLFQTHALGPGAQANVAGITWKFATGLGGTMDGDLLSGGGNGPYTLIMDVAQGTGLTAKAQKGTMIIVR